MSHESPLPPTAAWEKLAYCSILCLELPINRVTVEVPTGILNQFWIQVAVSESEATRPLSGSFESKKAKKYTVLCM
jgi:hypothetical protein